MKNVATSSMRGGEIMIFARRFVIIVVESFFAGVAGSAGWRFAEWLEDKFIRKYDND